MSTEAKLPLKPLDWKKIEGDWWAAKVERFKLEYEVCSSSNGTHIRMPDELSFELFDGSVEDAKAYALRDLSDRLSNLLDPAFLHDLDNENEAAAPKP